MRLGRKSGDGLGEGIEDRRGGTAGGFGFPGGRTGASVGGLGGAGVLLLLVFVVLSQCLGGGLGGSTSEDDYGSVFGRFPQAPAADGGPGARGGQDDTAVFVGAVVDDVQQTWAEQFRKAGQRYQPTVLVLFDNATRSGCGLASGETGPFYCPLDSKVYLDLGFFRELDQRFGAPGDFAQAYVIAHEFGHHVENLLGVLAQVNAEQRRNPDRANDLSIRVELAADCLAGVWAYSAYQKNELEPGDIEEGMNAAAAVGDDRIQRSTQGYVSPERWTHGSSRQRVSWFSRGFKSGKLADCDTFAVARP